MTTHIQHFNAPAIMFGQTNALDNQFSNPFVPYSLQAITAGSNIGLWIFNTSTMRLQGCATFKNLLMLPEQTEYSLMELFRLLDTTCRPGVISDIKRACIAPKTFVTRFAVPQHPGEADKWFKLTGKGCVSEDGFANFTGTLTDITEEITKETWNKDRLAILAHELKGPLSVIKLYVQRAGKIAKDNDGKDAHMFLKKADEQVNFMTVLMDDLLNNTPSELPGIDITHTWFSIKPIVDGIIDQLKLQHPHYNFVTKVPASLSVKANETQIIQVIKNYLVNAVKYSPADSKIEISCRKQNGEVMIAVSDNGIGIAPEHLPKVFDRYFRTLNSKAKGHGLGLYLVREIIKGHGGQVWAESVFNKGSVFYFSLPTAVNTFRV